MHNYAALGRALRQRITDQDNKVGLIVLRWHPVLVIERLWRNSPTHNPRSMLGVQFSSSACSISKLHARTKDGSDRN